MKYTSDQILLVHLIFLLNRQGYGDKLIEMLKNPGNLPEAIKIADKTCILKEMGILKEYKYKEIKFGNTCGPFAVDLRINKWMKASCDQCSKVMQY